MVGEPLEPAGNMANEGASATNGVLCHLAGLDGSGVRKESAWKAWTLADGSTNLRWELGRGVVVDCGFLDAKTTRLSVATGSWVTHAESLAHLFDFEKGAFAGRSMKALRVRGEEPEVGEGLENVAWVSTAALVLSLCSWLETRKKEQHKAMVKTTAVLFFEKVLPAGFAQGLDFTSPSGGAQNLCTIGPVLSGKCFCLGQALSSIARPKGATAARNHHASMPCSTCTACGSAPRSGHWPNISSTRSPWPSKLQCAIGAISLGTAQGSPCCKGRSAGE